MALTSYETRSFSDCAYLEIGCDRNILFDAIWIDGLHEYQQVHRDLQSAITVLKSGGWIGLHDLLPDDWLHEHMPRINRAWTGDVWKVGMELAASDALTARIVFIDSGCALVQADSPNAILADLSDQLLDKRFQYLFDNLDKMPDRLFLDDATTWIDGRRNGT